MPVECEQCKKDYPAQELVCPFCETPNSKLKEVKIPRTLHWRGEAGAAPIITEQMAWKERALLNLQKTIPQFNPYTTEGLQSAET